jgi:hypothetical protein
MYDLNDKANGSVLTPTQWNNFLSEIQNVIEDLGITLDGGQEDQLGEAIASYAMGGSFFDEANSTANVYVCTTVGNRQGPQNLGANADGMMARFRPSAANSGASTVNVNGIGVKDLKREDDTAVQSGDILTTRDVFMRWDYTADAWFLLDFSR